MIEETKRVTEGVVVRRRVGGGGETPDGRDYERQREALFSGDLTEAEFEGENDNKPFTEVAKSVAEYFEEEGPTWAIRLDPFDYVEPKGPYTEAEVSADLELVSKVESRKQEQYLDRARLADFRERGRPDGDYRKMLSDSFEVVFCGASNQFAWFGKDCLIQRTAFADDVHSGADSVLEMTPKKNESFFAGLKIDLTTSTEYSLIQKKKETGFNNLITYCREGVKAKPELRRRNTVRYYTNRNGQHQEIEPVIPIVLACDYKDAEKIILAIDKLSKTGSDSKEGETALVVNNLLSKHPIQKIFLEQIISQLIELRGKIRNNHGQVFERVSQSLDNMVEFFEKLLQEKIKLVDPKIKYSAVNV